MNEVNILMDILKQMLQEHPDSAFVNSLYQQYCNRGGLSKKQLEGLFDKVVKTPAIAQNKLATLEAIIRKKPTRERAAATIKSTAPVRDEATGQMLADILTKFPLHKRALFLQSKFETNEPLSGIETDEVKKFHAFSMKK